MRSIPAHQAGGEGSIPLHPHQVPKTKTKIKDLKCYIVPRGAQGRKTRQYIREILEKWHYIRKFNWFGRRLFLLWYDTYPDDPVGLVIFTNPFVFYLPDREKWIGWTDEQRKKNLNKKVADEVRFLILPHIGVKNLASQILAKSCKIARKVWKERYGDNLVLITCFITPEFYYGHSYLGAGFKQIGTTKNGKKIMAKPLKSYWRKELCR